MRGRTVSKRKYRGQARRTALQLFGVPWGKMESVEDRQHMALVLRLSADDRFRTLAQRAMDPLEKRTSFSRLAEQLGLNYHMISTEYKAIKTSEGFIRAAQHIPELMEQAAVDAKSRDEQCAKCKGTGQIAKPIVMTRRKGSRDDGAVEVPVAVECDICHGVGTIHVLGNAERLKLIFETFKLTGKESGGVNVNLDMRKITAGETLEDLAGTMSQVLDGETMDPK